jgi:hypothetical protein
MTEIFGSDILQLLTKCQQTVASGLFVMWANNEKCNYVRFSNDAKK